ncbi:MFS transporter [Kordiimonas pumila]|uniref:MFS transporter n=1 Tax=Kordiimonas pumila TaxID=2161677 RepID=A0ABV7D763_9PROT|nr:MFS transporter [Kordiimonas pumila]
MKKSIYAKTGFTLFALFFASVLAFLDRQLLNILVRPIRTDIGISDVEFSLLQGIAFALVYSVAAFPMAYLADRFSRKKVILISILAWSVMTVAFGLASSFSMLLLARIGLALGEAGLSPASISILRQIYPPERQSFAVAILTISVYIGGGISMTIGGPALAALETHAEAIPFGLAPWRVLFIGCGILGALGLAFLTLMPEYKHAPQAQGKTSLSAFFKLLKLKRARALAYLAAITGLSALLYAVMAWTPAMFMRSHGWSEQQTGLAYGIAFITGGVIGALGGGKLVGRLVKHGPDNATVIVIRYAAILLGVSTILSAVVSSGYTALIFASTAMVGVGTAISLGAFGFQALFPQQFSARAVAIYLLIPGTLGASLGPSSIPVIEQFLAHEKGTGMALAVFAGMMALWSTFWLSAFLRFPHVAHEDTISEA